MFQQGPGSFSHSIEHFVVLCQALKDGPNCPDLLRPAIFRGIGEKLHLRVQSEAIVLEEHFKPRALKDGLRHSFDRLSKSLDLLVL